MTPQRRGLLWNGSNLRCVWARLEPVPGNCAAAFRSPGLRFDVLAVSQHERSNRAHNDLRTMLLKYTGGRCHRAARRMTTVDPTRRSA